MIKLWGRNKEKISESEIELKVDRDSVCMGDDCESHMVNMRVTKNMTVSELLRELTDYIPKTSGAVWAVITDMGVCGYITISSDRNANYETPMENITILEAHITMAFCMHYYDFNFDSINKDTRERTEKFPECKTLLEKVKKASETKKCEYDKILKYIKICEKEG